MKKLLFIFALAALSSCGSENTVSPIPDTSFPEEALSESGPQSIDKSIRVGNYVSFEEPKVISLSKKKCSYFIKTRIDISRLDINSDVIELTLTKSERSSGRNSRSCPSTFGVNETNLKVYSLNKLISTYKNRRDSSLSANAFCSGLKGCKSAVLLKSKVSSYKGIPAVYNTIEFTMQDGETFTRSSWVATNNLFLNNFSYKIKRKGGSTIVDFKRALEFSMTNTL